MELLIVLAILAILSALAYPSITGAIENSRKAACALNLKQIGAASMLHVAEYGGRLPGIASAGTWQEVTSALSTGMGNTRVVQRHGQRPERGKIYCPSMKPWGPAARWPRAYVMNDYACRDPLITSPIGNAPPGLTGYKPGRMIYAFSRPAKTVLILESEKSSDTYMPAWDANSPTPIVLADGQAGPSWASTDQAFAFRHNGVMHVLYLDGHVEGLTLEQAQDLNQNYHFKPD